MSVALSGFGRYLTLRWMNVDYKCLKTLRKRFGHTKNEKRIQFRTLELHCEILA